MPEARERLQDGSRGVQKGVLLLSRTWPQRAYLYASLKEQGGDVYAVEHPGEARDALWRWPRRFDLLLLDAAEYSEAEIADALELCRAEGLGGLVVCGAFERGRLSRPLPVGVAVLQKPISVNEVVQCALGKRGHGP